MKSWITNASAAPITRAVRLSILASSIVFVACANVTPTLGPTPPATRPDAPAATRQTLAEVLAELNNALDQTRAFLAAFATSTDAQPDEAAQCPTRARALLKASPMYTQLAVADVRGILYCNTEQNPHQITVANRADVELALYTRTFAVGSLIDKPRETPEPALGVAYPILAGGKLRGVVMSTLKLSWLAERLAQIPLAPGGEIALVDRNGTLLLREPPLPIFSGRNILNTPMGYLLERHRQGSVQATGLDGERRIYAFALPQGAPDSVTALVGIKP